ncbi:MAG TPA: ATP-binding protein [Gemmatimonadales bacterium]|jgi:signal transduction histidine kinase|nr:ATP-binding protein [Gemmatimonadales bacterium]
MERAALKETDLLRTCSDAELDELLAASSEVRLAPGEPLFTEVDRADAVWVLLEGELVITKTLGGDEVVADQLHPGVFLGEISLLTGAPAGHRAHASGDARLLRIPGDTFLALIRRCPAVMETVLRTMAARVQKVARFLTERERMVGLGTLAAGLVHELKNPAAAASRALALLGEHISQLGPLGRRLAMHPWTPEDAELLERLDSATCCVRAGAKELDPLERSEREEAVAEWLERFAIERPWEVAPLLVDRGLGSAELDRLAGGRDVAVVADALAWTERIVLVRQLLEEAGQSTSRITELVRAVKGYSHMDTSTVREIDVHDSIESSLTILGHKLKQSRVRLQREYDRSLPKIRTYGTELSQLWTNLLDNAADAVAAEGGTVVIRTSRANGGVAVQITDSGPGIPADVRSRIFDPFFTTKEAGKGTGLGLEIAKRIVLRHGGDIQVDSAPGRTTFAIRLPAVH